MDINAEKTELVKMIMETEDASIIERIRNVFSKKEERDFYDDFTEDQKLEIQYGIDQLDRGERISWEDLKKRLP